MGNDDVNARIYRKDIMTYSECLKEDAKWMWVITLYTLFQCIRHLGYRYIHMYVLSCIAVLCVIAYIRYMRNGKSLIE